MTLHAAHTQTNSHKQSSKSKQKLIEIAQKSGCVGVEDFLSLDYFFWKELQDIKHESDTIQEDDKVTKKQKEFVHNDVRDQIMEIASLPLIRDEVKFWNYKDVIQTHASLTSAMESINGLGLVPDGMIK